MKIQVEAFGIAKDIFGKKHIEIRLQTGCSVLDLKETLMEKFPKFKALRSFAIAVNESYALDTDQLTETDKIVIIPPVSGG